MPSNILSFVALVAALSCFAAFFLLDRMVDRGTTAMFDRRGIKALRLPSGEARTGMSAAPAMRLLTLFGGPVLRYAIALPAAVALYKIGYTLSALWLVVALSSGWIIDGIFNISSAANVPRSSRTSRAPVGLVFQAGTRSIRR